MLEYLKQEANRTLTENGGAAYQSTGSDCLDFFAAAGALRREDDGEIIARFQRAWAEDADLAMKLLFYTRDIRGGLGERRVFRILLRWLAAYCPRSVERNLARIPEFGRWDDLLPLLDTPCRDQAAACMKAQFQADLDAMERGEPVSLLAKWLPSANASNRETVRCGKLLARAFGLTEAAYRKRLSALRSCLRILENSLRERDYRFDYEKQPSKALFKYRAAFIRNDGPRYREYVTRVALGEAVMHTGTLFPYEIIAPFFAGPHHKTVTEEERAAIDAAWKSQEDFTRGENALVVVDGSGSMYAAMKPLPAAVALSLGIYYGERCRGAFHNHFITFSEHPRLVEIKGGDILDRVRYCSSFNEVANTNLFNVFILILETAVKHQVPPEDMPSTLYVISDMEFDACTADASATNFSAAKRLFAENGYPLPKVIFWNVASRNRQVPVTENEQGAVLVSGCSPRIFSMVAENIRSPREFMLFVLNSRRYRDITA